MDLLTNNAQFFSKGAEGYEFFTFLRPRYIAVNIHSLLYHIFFMTKISQSELPSISISIFIELS